VVRCGLNIRLDDDEKVEISPEYELLPQYQDKKLRFFEDYVYVDGEGFHELPSDSRLPDRFRHPVVIEPENLDIFLNYELETLKQYAAKIDPRLLLPRRINLVATNISRDESKGQGWYSLKLKYHTDKGDVPISTLYAKILQKKRFCFTEEGLFDLDNKR